MPRRSRVLALILLAALAAAGCAGKVETIHTSAGFAPADLAADRLGLGGVVLGARLASDPAAATPEDVPAADPFAQSEAWAPVLYRQLLVRARDVTVWPWPSVRDACGDSALAPVLATFGRAGVLRPEQLAALGADLDGLRYLAFARVDADDLSLEDMRSGSVANPQVRDNRDPHASNLSAAVKTRRTVTVTLDVYDLAQGVSVWTTTARRHRDELFDYEKAGAKPRTGVVPEGEPVITADRRSLPAPPFAEVFEDACGALAERLLAPESR